MSKFTYIELFAGIGGFRQALDKLGGKCVFASEIDKFASQAYQNLYGNDHLFGDITKINEKDIPNHDLIVAGIPCQAFSVAGKRLGFDDTRGTLFFDVVRIAKEKQPKSVIIENVKGLVGHDKGKTLDTIVKTLNDIGYRVDFEVLNSKFFGVPQNRERIFIVAVREDLVDNEAWTNVKGATVVPKGKRRIGEWAKTFNFDWPEQAEVTTRLRDILESNVDEKYYLDEDKTAKLVAKLSEENQRKFDEVSNERIIQLNGDRDKPGLSTNDKEAYTIPANPMSDRGQLLQEPQMLGHVDIKGNDSIKRTYSTEGISPTLTTMGGGHREPKIAVLGNVSNTGHNNENVHEVNGISPTVTARDYKGAKLIAEEAGLPIREATKKGYAIAQEGDSVNVQFPDSKTRRGCVGKQIANTLEASSINRGVVESPPKYRIRKLTPLECFRLQNFPDEAHQNLLDAGISDSQRYKMAGNAVTVSVVEAIAKNLLPLIVGGGTGFEESETSS